MTLEAQEDIKPILTRHFPEKEKFGGPMVDLSMRSNPFKSASAWLLFLHGILGPIAARAEPEPSPVPTSIQYDPHFIGWFIGPATSESFSPPLPVQFSIMKMQD